MQVLVTGGAGFIGSHLVDRLLEEGAAVRVVDNFALGRKENLAPMLDRIELVEGDIRHPQVAIDLMVGVDTVFHLAALGSVSRSVEDPTTTHLVNVDGTLNLLEAARKAGVRRFVYSSSSSVYGETPTLPKHEELAPEPISPYGVSKLAAEMYCRAYWKVYGLETISLRYFNVFGPRQSPNSLYAAVIPRFISQVKKGESPTIYGDGEQGRDFTYVDNVVDANLLAMRSSEGFGQTFNIACGERVSVRCLADTVIRLLDQPVQPVYLDPRPGDIRDSMADISQAQRLLGYRHRVAFEEGLKRTVAWYTNGAGMEG